MARLLFLSQRLNLTMADGQRKRLIGPDRISLLTLCHRQNLRLTGWFNEMVNVSLKEFSHLLARIVTAVTGTTNAKISAPNLSILANLSVVLDVIAPNLANK